MGPLSDCSLFIHMADNSAKMVCVSYGGWELGGGWYGARNKSVVDRIRRITTVYFSQ